MRSASFLVALPAPLLLLVSAALTTPAHAAEGNSGLVIEYTKNVTCLRPTENGDGISVHYKGVLEGEEAPFDSSYPRGAPFSFKLGAAQVIKGWDEGLLNMCVGEQRKLTIPPELGYGDRRVGPIPAGSTLVFTTELMGIAGVPAEEPLSPVAPDTPEDSTADKSASEDEEDVVGDQYEDSADEKVDSEMGEKVDDGMDDKFANSTNENANDDGEKHVDDDDEEDNVHENAQVSDTAPIVLQTDAENAECRLLGPFALFVQSALGVLALLSLVFKRWRERPRRPIKVWFFDVSKQVIGTALLHVFNIGLSMFAAGSGVDAASQAYDLAQSAKDEQGRMPNPCSFYLLNLAIDTTIGVPVLLVFLNFLHALFLRTPLAEPRESIKSGHYGQPPQAGWWVKQSFIYFLGLLLMKLFVFFLFAALPWLPWVGDWALRWTEGNESLQIAFVMFIFPLAMNMIQYYVIDMFIKDRENGQGGGQEGYQSVHSEDSIDSEEAEERRRLTGSDEDDDENKDGVQEPRVHTADEGSSSSGTPPDTARAKDADI